MASSFSEKKRTSQLGMPIGTATHRLRKLVLFSLVVQSNQNICFRCNGVIEFADELSIEHKVAWLDNDVALFWDMDNIAFSHLKCNISATRTNTADRVRGHVDSTNKRRISVSDGHSRCCRCKEEKPHNAFTRNRSKPDGLDTECKKCRRMRRNKQASV